MSQRIARAYRRLSAQEMEHNPYALQDARELLDAELAKEITENGGTPSGEKVWVLMVDQTYTCDE